LPDLRRKEKDKFAAGLKGSMPFKGVGEGSKVVQQLVGDRGDERSCHQDQHLHTDGHICHILSLTCMVISQLQLPDRSELQIAMMIIHCQAPL